MFTVGLFNSVDFADNHRCREWLDKFEFFRNIYLSQKKDGLVDEEQENFYNNEEYLFWVMSEFLNEYDSGPSYIEILHEDDTDQSWSAIECILF